jgi:hypothetical protein
MILRSVGRRGRLIGYRRGSKQLSQSFGPKLSHRSTLSTACGVLAFGTLGSQSIR